MLALAVLTYGSRVLALALLPPMPVRIALILERMPAPLFAGLAMQALLTPQGPAPLPVFVAAAGALAVSPLRSLPVCLVAGLVTYALAALIAP